jgi:hypothetical protein
VSAGGLARLGIRCADPSTGIATLGIYCGAFVAPPVSEPTTGGGSKRSRIHVPGITGNKALAFREDEEVIAVLQAFLASRTKN